MQPGTEILIGASAILVTALVLGGIQVSRMNKTFIRPKRNDNPTLPTKSIHEQLEETLAERQKIIESLEKK